jgi:hypothetical protein
MSSVLLTSKMGKLDGTFANFERLKYKST